MNRVYRSIVRIVHRVVGAGSPRAVNPVRDFQAIRPVSRDSEVDPSETDLERDTGIQAPSTNQPVKFSYRLG